MNPFSFIDAHVHTALSDDSQCPMEEYWAYLESGQAKAIGFAEHWHPGIEAQFEKYPEFKRSAPFDNRTYKQKIEQGRAKGYTLYRGVELTYETQWHDLCMDAIHSQDFDYVMGSAHSFGGLWITREYWMNLDTGFAFPWIMDQYYQAVRQCLLVPEFDVIAHIGIYRRNFPPNYYLLQYAKKQIEDLEDEIALAAARSGKVIEVNTSGMTKPAAGFLPGPFFLKRFLHYGGEKICLSSDAHFSKNLNLCFGEAAEQLVDLGFKALYYPWDPDTAVPLV